MSSTEGVSAKSTAGSGQPQPSEKKEEKEKISKAVKTNTTDTITSATNASQSKNVEKSERKHKKHRHKHRKANHLEKPAVQSARKTAGCCDRMFTSIIYAVTGTLVNVVSDTVHAAVYATPCTLLKVSAHLPFNKLNLDWNQTLTVLKNSTLSVIPKNIKGSTLDFFKNPKTLGPLGTFVAANAIASLANQVWKHLPLLNRTPQFLRSVICLGGALYLSNSYANQHLGVAQQDVFNLALKTYAFALTVNTAVSIAHVGGRSIKMCVEQIINGAGWLIGGLLDRVSWNSDLYAVGTFGR